MTTAKAKLGDLIEVYCTRCRLNLDANVAAVYEEQVKQVECRTCGNFIDYRPPKDMAGEREKALKRLIKMRQKKEKGVEKGATGTAEAEGPSPESERWEELTRDVTSWQARPYDRHRVFSAGDYILHKKHGMGYIESADADAGTLIGLFKDGFVELEHSQPIEE